MIIHPLARAYRLLAQGLEKNNKTEILLAAEMEVNNSNIGDDSILCFEFLPISNPRVELSLETNTRDYNEWDAAVAEAVDALSNLKV